MFGFGKGKILIIIPSTSYSPGDIILGKVVLTVKKPVRAREACISLIGEETITRYTGTRSKRSRTREIQRIYDFKQRLDVEKEYYRYEEYNFKIEIPADILSRQTLMPQVGGILGQWIELAQALSRMGGRTRFFLEAKLNIPGGLDINRRKRITIR